MKKIQDQELNVMKQFTYTIQDKAAICPAGF